MYEGLCPACHHKDHDPGSCEECPRCELHYDEAIEWLRRYGALPRLDAEAAALAQRITEAVNAGERPVDDMGLASILHHFAHQVADDRDDAAVSA